MSNLVPPSPFYISKAKDWLKSNLSEATFKEVEKQLPPWPVFKIRIEFHSGIGELPKIYTEQEILTELNGLDLEELELKENIYESIDTALFNLTRLVETLKERPLTFGGTYRFCLLSRTVGEFTVCYTCSEPVNGTMDCYNEHAQKVLDRMFPNRPRDGVRS